MHYPCSPSHTKVKPPMLLLIPMCEVHVMHTHQFAHLFLIVLVIMFLCFWLSTSGHLSLTLCLQRALLSQVLLRLPGNNRVCLHEHLLFDPFVFPEDTDTLVEIR